MHPKHMSKLMGKKIFTILRSNFFLVYLIIWNCHFMHAPKVIKAFLYDQPDWVEYEISTAYKNKNAEN